MLVKISILRSLMILSAVLFGLNVFGQDQITRPTKQKQTSSQTSPTKRQQTAPPKKTTVTVSEADGYANGAGYVNLGLSVKWATCNLGASSPEQYGNYYAWAETKPRTGSSWDYDWNTTPYYKSGDSYSNVTWSKYTGSDGKKVLDPQDDAATVALGSPWRMPTLDEIKELLDKCKWTWTTMNGKEGYKVVGPNGNSIFLPAAGYRRGASLFYAGAYGLYWSSSLYTSYPNYAYYLYFYSGSHYWSYKGSRYGGLSVRPVRP